MKRTGRGIIAGMLLTLCAARAQSQLLVRVESSGVPVHGADVAVWNTTSRLAAARTDAMGESRLRVAGADSNAFVVVRRMGFSPARVALTRRDTITVELAAVVATLPVLDVAVHPLDCSTPSQPEAENLWKAAASMYAPGASELWLDAEGGWVDETVTTEQRGFGDGDPLKYGRLGYRQPGGAPVLFAEYERHINILGEYWQWRYLPLDQYGAEHFLSTEFLRDNMLTVLGRNQGATVIGFCSRRDAKVRIEGELQVGPDSLLRAARWFFRVPHDDEDAGGEATFARTAFEDKWFLVPVRSSFWRRAGKNLYRQQRRELTSWRFRRTRQAEAHEPAPSRRSASRDDTSRASRATARR